MSAVLHITRNLSNDECTRGRFKLLVDDKVVKRGETLEPIGEDCDRAGKNRRIPEGRYYARFRYSPRFKRKLPTLYNDVVSSSRRILIHSGNYSDDTTGCILLGERGDSNSIYESRKCIDEVFSYLNENEEFIVEIKNNKGV